MTRPPDGGFVTAQLVAATGLSLLLFVACVNVLVVAYARAAVRAALDEGARAGARAEAAEAACEQRAGEVLEDLLGGALGAGVEPVRCMAAGGRLRASTRATFDGWLPGMPRWTLLPAAVAGLEPPP